MRLIDADDAITIFTNRLFEMLKTHLPCVTATENQVCLDTCYKIAKYEIDNISTAYDVEKVVAEVKKLDLDGVSMVEDGKYRLVRKNEVISIIQTNGVCNGRHSTCADCYKMNCPLSTEKTFTDKWSEEVRKGGVE